MGENTKLNHLKLYRLPWTLPDNAISWLEPTSACNLMCEGCYRENVPRSHKSLEIILGELETFRRLRKSDAVSITGGDPLVHPQIADIVKMVQEMGFKPILNTNGAVLTEKMLGELKKAGAYGFTFHVDSKQGRPKWENKNELELNELRWHYAEMLKKMGGLCCAFNATVYHDTLQYVPDLVEWAARNIDKVQAMVFILYRAAVPNLPFNWYAGENKIEMRLMEEKLPYAGATEGRIDLKSTEVVEGIRRRFPEFTPCAYLNGTEKPDDFKWLLSCRLGNTERIFGYAGSKFMELVQTFNHLLKGRYLGYVRPESAGWGKRTFLLSPFDAGIREISKRYLKSMLINPALLFNKLYLQSVMIIQPIDFMENGLQNMCDGCPDMTVWDGKLAWSCRLEELKQFGTWVRTVRPNNNKD
jgi:pyruvate-formate lyase-activating enzyme